MNSHLRRLLGFGLVPALSMLSSILLLPIISVKIGPSGWTAVAVGQSIGAIFSSVVSLAWGVIGGHKIATSDSLVERRKIYRSSVHSRSLVFLLVVICVVPILLLTVSGERLSTVLFMVGVSFNGLTASWYFSGVGLPKMLILNEGVVRFSGYFISIILLLLGLPLFSYALITVFSGIVMFILNWKTIMGGEVLYLHGDLRAAIRTIRDQLLGAASRAFVALFSFGGPTIIGAVSPSSLAIFSAFDQVQKASKNALDVVPQSFVWWIDQQQMQDRGKKYRRFFAFTLTSSALILVSFCALGAFVMRILFAGAIVPDFSEIVLVSLLITLTYYTHALELVILIPSGKQRFVYILNIALTIFGLIVVGVLTAWLGVAGALSGFAVSYFCLSVAYSFVAFRVSKR